MAKKILPVVDPTLPKVSFESGGTTYNLCFDYNALATAEGLTGLNLIRHLDFQNPSASVLRALLYAALLKFQPETTLESAGSLITSVKAFSEIVSKIVEVYVASMPEPAEETESEPKNE